MKIGEAITYEQQFWTDMDTMPTEVQDRVLAMAEQTPAFHEAQVALSGLQLAGGGLANAIQRRIAYLAEAQQANEASVLTTSKVIERPQTTTEDQDQDRQLTPHQVVETCEPIEMPQFTVPASFDTVVAKYADHLFATFKDVRQTTERSVRGLGPKKAARLKAKEEEYTDRLFRRPAEDQSNSWVHIADDPSRFCYVDNELTNRAFDQTRPQHERDLYLDLARRFIKSGEDYVAEHADELAQTDHYIPELLMRYAEEMIADPATRGPAAHLMRGFFKTANTPERAVGRLNRIVEAYIDGYRGQSFLNVVATGIFLWRADFMQQSPVYENLLVASISFHKPGLPQAARQLMQLPVLYAARNSGIDDYTEVNKILQGLERTRQVQIGTSGEKILTELRRLVPNFDEALRRYQADEDLIKEAQVKHPLDRTAGMQAYLDAVTNQPGPAYTDLFLIPNKLMQRYETVIGNVNLRANPLTDNIIIDGDYIADILWPSSGVADSDKAMIRATIIDRADRDELNKAKQRVNLGLGLANHRFTPMTFEGHLVTAASQTIPIKLRLRRRTQYDNEHTSPLTDFDMSGFESRQGLSELSSIVDYIRQNWSRVVPKRGIEVGLDDAALQSGLTTLAIYRLNGNRLVVEATIHGHARQFQIKDYQFFNKRGRLLNPKATWQSHLFASYCLSAIAEWMCRPKIDTSEGTIEEGKEGPIKGGYFAYLPIMSNGYKKHRQDKQWYLCVDERGVDLDIESERLKLKPESKGRNSTYYREHADDGPHLPPLKVYL